MLIGWICMRACVEYWVSDSCSWNVVQRKHVLEMFRYSFMHALRRYQVPVHIKRAERGNFQRTVLKYTLIVGWDIPPLGLNTSTPAQRSATLDSPKQTTINHRPLDSLVILPLYCTRHTSSRWVHSSLQRKVKRSTYSSNCSSTLDMYVVYTSMKPVRTLGNSCDLETP